MSEASTCIVQQEHAIKPGLAVMMYCCPVTFCFCSVSTLELKQFCIGSRWTQLPRRRKHARFTLFVCLICLRCGIHDHAYLEEVSRDIIDCTSEVNKATRKDTCPFFILAKRSAAVTTEAQHESNVTPARIPVCETDALHPLHQLAGLDNKTCVCFFYHWTPTHQQGQDFLQSGLPRSLQ